MKFLGTLLLLILIAAAVAGYVIYIPFGPGAETFVDIAPGTGTPAIAMQLEKSGVIRSRYGFDLLHLIKHEKLKAGEYRFDHATPMTEVYERIVRGDVYVVSLKIPEGYNIFDIAQAVATAGLGSRDAFLAAERQHTELLAWLPQQDRAVHRRNRLKAISFPTPITSPVIPPRCRCSPRWCGASARSALNSA